MHWLTYLALILGAYVLYKVVYWTYQGMQMGKSGHVPPSPSWLARTFFVFMSGVIARKKVGPVAVEGQENLPSKGRLMFVGTHTYELDFAMITVATRRSCRSMAAASGLTGLRAIFGAWTGTIPVDREQKGGGDRAVEGSIKAFSQFANECFMIFPQGKLVEDNVLRRADFRTGFARIAKGTKRLTGDEPMYIIPIAIDYKRDPSCAINEWAASHPRHAFGKTNYGAAVIVGAPIKIEDVPDDLDKATDLIFERLVPLLDRAKQLPGTGKTASTTQPKDTSGSHSNNRDCCGKDS